MRGSTLARKLFEEPELAQKKARSHGKANKHVMQLHAKSVKFEVVHQERSNDLMTKVQIVNLDKSVNDLGKARDAYHDCVTGFKPPTPTLDEIRVECEPVM